MRSIAEDEDCTAHIWVVRPIQDRLKAGQRPIKGESDGQSKAEQRPIKGRSKADQRHNHAACSVHFVRLTLSRGSLPNLISVSRISMVQQMAGISPHSEIATHNPLERYRLPFAIVMEIKRNQVLVPPPPPPSFTQPTFCSERWRSSLQPKP